MNETVTDIIVSRSRQADPLKAMLLWSLAAHGTVIVGLAAMPDREGNEPPPVVMTINLGGAPGPKTGGMTQIGSRAVQAKAVEPPRVETPPAPERPVMALPDPRTRPQPQKPRPEEAPKDATARALSTGDEPRPGTTQTERVRGQGFDTGLSSAGGAGGPIEVDAVNFCCNEYLVLVRDQIQRNWTANQGYVGMTKMKFTIQRNGTITAIVVERPSGITSLDLASQTALQRTPRLPPLPAQYTNQTLTVHMTFEYQR